MDSDFDYPIRETDELNDGFSGGKVRKEYGISDRNDYDADEHNVDDRDAGFDDVASFRRETDLTAADISDADVSRLLVSDANEQARQARRDADKYRAQAASASRPVYNFVPQRATTHTVRLETPRFYPTSNSLAYEYELAQERTRRREAEDMARNISRDYGYATRSQYAPRPRSPRRPASRSVSRTAKKKTAKHKTKAKAKSRSKKTKKR